MQITVSDPREQKPKFGKPYVEYLVRTVPEEGTDWMVRRRYSDFEWLRAVIKRKYVFHTGGMLEVYFVASFECILTRCLQPGPSTKKYASSYCSVRCGA